MHQVEYLCQAKGSGVILSANKSTTPVVLLVLYSSTDG